MKKDIAYYRTRIRKIWTFSEHFGTEKHTSAKTQIEAWAVQEALDKTYPEYSWYVIDGPKDYKTQKPNCYIITGKPKGA